MNIELSNNTCKKLPLKLFSYLNVAEIAEESKTYSDFKSVLNKLGIDNSFLKKPPFCHLKSNAYTWEYCVLGFWLSKCGKELSTPQYNNLKASHKGLDIYGKKRKRGNANKKIWESFYKWTFTEEERDSNEILKLEKNVAPFAEYLYTKQSALRIIEKENVKLFSNAAKAFLSYLCNDVDQAAIIKIATQSETDIRLLQLLTLTKSELDNHVFVVSLLFCMYGHKRHLTSGGINVDLGRKVIEILKEKQVPDEGFKEILVNKLESKIETAKENRFTPPYVSVYNKVKKLNIQKRLTLWLNLINEAFDASQKK